MILQIKVDILALLKIWKNLSNRKMAQFKQNIFKNLETAYSEKNKEYWKILNKKYEEKACWKYKWGNI